MENTTGTKSARSTYQIGELNVNRLGYGAMQLTGPGVWGDAVDRDAAIEILQKAVEWGVNFIDTADAYGPDTNERLIADALYPYREGLVIATKSGNERPGPNRWLQNGHPEYIRKAIDGCLSRLKVDQIHLWQLHRIDPKVPVEKTLEPIAEAVNAGKIKYVGLSEVGIEEIEKVQKIVPVASVQNLYNLGDRHWEEVVDYTAQHGMAFIPWFPLASGPEKLAGKIRAIAEKKEATTAQIALAWLLKRSPNILLIPGTRSLQHLKENLQAEQFSLTDEEFAMLS